MKNFIHQNFLIHLKFKFPKELKHLYLFSILRSILMISFGLFIPLFLYENLGIEYVILYFFLSYGLFRLVPLLFIKKLVSIGVEVSYFLSILFLIILGILIKFLTPSYLLVLIISLLNAFSLSFYWFPLNITIAKFSKSNTTQSRFFVQLLISIIKITFPLVSAYVIIFIGMKNFFLSISLFVLIVSIYVLYKLMKRKKLTKIDFEIKPSYDYNLLFFVFEAVFISLIFLLYVILIASEKDIKGLGFILTLSNLISLALLYIITKIIDKKRDFDFLLIGLLFLVVINLHVYFTENIILPYLFSGFVVSLISLTYFSYLYNYVKVNNNLYLFYFRELILALVFSLIFGITYLFNLDIKEVFYFLTLSLVIFSVYFHLKTKEFEIYLLNIEKQKKEDKQQDLDYNLIRNMKLEELESIKMKLRKNFF